MRLDVIVIPASNGPTGLGVHPDEVGRIYFVRRNAQDIERLEAGMTHTTGRNPLALGRHYAAMKVR